MTDADLPDELPVDGKGFHIIRRAGVIARSGSFVGASVVGPDAAEFPIAYRYDSRPGGVTGFSIYDNSEPVRDIVPSWKDLCEEWKRWRAAKRPALVIPARRPIPRAAP